MSETPTTTIVFATEATATILDEEVPDEDEDAEKGE
jgi:hypothetical protein